MSFEIAVESLFLSTFVRMNSAATNGDSGLHAIVVGAGIAGLAAATGLAQKGHSVTVLESKPALNEFGASIGLLANGVRPIKSWGLQKEFEKVVTKNGFLDMRNGFTNDMLGHNPHNKNNFGEIQYGEETWNINRKDCQQVLAKAAEASGAKILFDSETLRVDVDRCIVILRDGRELAADMIVGADGMQSAVRKSIPATGHVEPLPLEEACFRCTIPKFKMRANSKLEWLLENEDEMIWTAPGRYVLSWPLPVNRDYDVVTCIQRASDVPAGRWGMKADPDEARRDFGDFCPEVRQLLQHIDGCVKWTLAELPPLETCRSENGRVVLIGDAFHAMLPHTASGKQRRTQFFLRYSTIDDYILRHQLTYILHWWQEATVASRTRRVLPNASTGRFAVVKTSPLQQKLSKTSESRESSECRELVTKVTRSWEPRRTSCPFETRLSRRRRRLTMQSSNSQRKSGAQSQSRILI